MSGRAEGTDGTFESRWQEDTICVTEREGKRWDHTFNTQKKDERNKIKNITTV